jgi:hypothetical protein
VAAQLVANNWVKSTGGYATREEIMMTLAKVDNVLIKLQYINGPERDVELLNILFDSAGQVDYGLGSASLVEECRCPNGYRGLSCEECDFGYVRQSTGPWLGRCVREEEPCRPGQYGDPNNGVPCKACPCPVPGNSFARTCQLDRTGSVVCDCDRGYAGARCEVCAPGYEGNPMTASGCRPRPTSSCNPDGTQRVLPNGRCECKLGVNGTRCDQCATDSFYLNPNGCVECFCMGVSKTCSSTSQYRDTIRSSLSSNAKQYSVVAGYDSPTVVSDSLELEDRELVFRDFNGAEEPYYWSLPSKYAIY